MHLNPIQPPAQTHGPSRGWVLHFPAGLGWVVPALTLKICPASAQPIGTLGFFFIGPVSFFFQKRDNDEYDTLVAMGTQHDVCVSCAPSCSHSYWLERWLWPPLVASGQVLPTGSPRGLGGQPHWCSERKIWSDKSREIRKIRLTVGWEIDKSWLKLLVQNLAEDREGGLQGPRDH